MSKSHIHYMLSSATRTEYVPYEKTVIEKRAPTDESIRIYKEMKEKAEQSILDTIVINDNSLNIKAVLFKADYDYCTTCRYQCAINGREIQGEVKQKGGDVDKDQFVRDIIDHASKQIALNIIKSVIPALSRM